MPDICSIPLLAINPDCTARIKNSGANKRIYRGFIEDIQAITYDADGAISTLTLKASKTLFAYYGQDYTNNAVMGFTRYDNGEIEWPHSVTFVAHDIEQADLNAIEAGALASGTFAIVPTNSGQIKVYGLNKGANWALSTGLKVNTISDAGTGTVKGDGTGVTLLMEGSADAPPRYFVGAPGDTYNDIIADLDAMLVASGG